VLAKVATRSRKEQAMIFDLEALVARSNFDPPGRLHVQSNLIPDPAGPKVPTHRSPRFTDSARARRPSRRVRRIHHRARALRTAPQPQEG
jgi:hypothetical protein